ncbi:MAG: CPBP family intramembrane glutamic endopeptidase [Promethearchaeota archaeon]
MSETEEENIEEKVQKRFGKVILGEIYFDALITLIFLLSVYNIPELYYLSMLTILFILLVKFLRDMERVLNYIYVGIALFLLVLPFNIFYEIFTNILLKNLLENPVGLQVRFNITVFFAYYGLLSLFSIIATFIIALIYYYQSKKTKEVVIVIAAEEDTTPTFGTWEYFLTDTDYKKFFMLIVFLTFAAIFEEILFRFFLINLLLMFAIPIFVAIIISGIIFGLAHYGNGGWHFVVNSIFSGIIFGFSFYYYGLFFSTFLHFCWNFLVVAQMFINYKLLPNYMNNNNFRE